MKPKKIGVMSGTDAASFFENYGKEWNEELKAEQQAEKDKDADNEFDDVIELFKECGLDELLEEGE